MQNPKILDNEKDRLAKLYEFSLLDTLEEEEYDQITKLAANICGVPISLISLIDKDRQWFKSKHGLKVPETPRDFAFCAHAINDPKNTFVVEDSRKDERFFDNPLVVNDPNVVFYAGVPLVTNENLALGTLCVIDSEPKTLSLGQKEALEILAHQVIKLFELRKKTLLQERYLRELETRNKGLEEFARVAAHDIKSPLANIKGISELFFDDDANLSSEQKDLIHLINDSAAQLSDLIDGILNHSRTKDLILNEMEWVNPQELVIQLLKMLHKPDAIDVRLECDPALNLFYTNPTAFQQILINLISNAFKYNKSVHPFVLVKMAILNQELIISIIDNGPGIALEDQGRVFELFQTTANTDSEGGKGTGIGLATVKELVIGLGGTIALHAKQGEGSEFRLSLPTV
jgi:signal transduction histidine kinase